MFAKVIVDVPAKQTNRAFDYIVPPALKAWVEVGSRVTVPFGPRVVQGFVVELHEETDVKIERLKSIQSVPDLVPPLTVELVGLAHWMSRTYLCHEVTALQVMLPGALKAKYERGLQVGIEPQMGSLLELPERLAILDFVRCKGTLSMEALMDRFPHEGAAIKDMVLSGALVEVQMMKDRISMKKVLTVFPPKEVDSLVEAGEKLPAKARKQKEVLDYLSLHPDPIRLTELMELIQVGAGTVKALADRGLIELKEIEVMRDPYAGRTFARTMPLPLTDEQSTVYAEIRSAIVEGKPSVFLLQGVTGSGKTEVYLQSIQQCLELGKEAIVLVPEISLTPQMVERFKGRFGNEVAVLHSRLSQGERYDEWRKIMRKQVRVVIGARSAVFAPFQRLGLIIIDEEHESSYKQEDSPKYHAREIAVQRAENNGATVVLGSATPSLESIHRTSVLPDHGTTESPSYRLLTMKSRVEGRPLPEVFIVDMREELKNGNRSMFSKALHHAIEERLHKKEQIVMLLNRRGYATFVMCRTCGYVSSCPHCDISLTYHQSTRMLRCHYCGYAEREVKLCPSCGSEHIRHFGTGTQRVEEELGKLFPGIRVIRMDVDTTTEKGSHEKWLTMFGQKQADVLLGTQMVAKGLDFPDVTLVGVIAADTSLNIPDFRSAERTFQLLTQVAGRAGRHQKLGEVYVQTYTPEHYSVQCASRHDYNSFVTEELHSRIRLGYPPYQRLILVTFSHEQAPFLIRAAEAFAVRLKELIEDVQRKQSTEMLLSLDGFEEPQAADFSMEVLGPVASPISRIKDRYRFQCVVKYRGDGLAVELVGKAVAYFEQQNAKEKLQISIDVDPQYLM
ncbi:primosomal protein N' [Paenibacillus eucommiae]|uniref:Replication restart protein PriA n=1 Tax=Paenibacillus eucommiae TaxID=1355755 RepID=A0ABS4IV19_9BACL|nr:primosomal protein N' [Paenibacillus eucommiae]MBP1991437.1 primosomal protein N' (replication factor Y) [Paenibacillus eucommiae]